MSTHQADPARRAVSRHKGASTGRNRFLMTVFLIFLLLPIYWLVSMSLKTNNEILSTFSLWPQNLTLDSYRRIFTDPSWYMGYVNSLTYVGMNMLISILVALPAAWYFTGRWLDNFAYRPDSSWLVFVLPVVFVGLVSWLVVGLISWRAARLNPKDAIQGRE